MTRVSFYLFKAGGGDRQHFVCRLLERIYNEGQRGYAYLPDSSALADLDEALWTFRPGSFVPHELAPSDEAAPILLGDGQDLPGDRQVLLNLDYPSLIPPDFFSSFERCLEFVSGDDAERAAARKRYAFYRDRGYALDTFDLSADRG